MKEWGDEDAIILCRRWDLSDSTTGCRHPLAQKDVCELCDVELACFPASINQAKKPHFHLVCRACAAKLDEIHGTIPYARIKDPHKFPVTPEFEKRLAEQKPKPVN